MTDARSRRSGASRQTCAEVPIGVAVPLPVVGLRSVDLCDPGRDHRAGAAKIGGDRRSSPGAVRVGSSIEPSEIGCHRDGEERRVSRPDYGATTARWSRSPFTTHDGASRRDRGGHDEVVR